MVYGFIKQSNGHIKIYSELGRGTTFRLYLPRGDDGGAGERADASRARCRAATERILVVEDDEQVRAAVAATSSRAWATTSSQAADGRAALEAAARATRSPSICC